MPVVVEETWGRELNVEVDTSGFTAKFHVFGSTSESDVYAAVVAGTPLSFSGLYRKRISPKELAGGRWECEVEYGNINPWEAVGTTPTIPTGPSPGDPLGPGHTFTTLGGTTRITQSIATRSRTLNGTVAGGALKDFRQAIGVTRDGVEGCDVVSPTLEFSRTVRRADVTTDFLNTLAYVTGQVNFLPFYGFNRNEVLYVGCEGSYAQDSKWTITHRFHVSPNREDYVVARAADGTAEITVPDVRGWDYLWVQYVEIIEEGFRIRKPLQANVEQVYLQADFDVLEIGGV